MLDAASLKSPGKLGRLQRWALDIDRYVGARIRERRLMLGLSQQEMARLIGVTYQQVNKYERGVNRIAASRLFTIAQTLSVDVDYFFDGMHSKRARQPTPQQRMLLELARSFISITNYKQQEAICRLARALVCLEPQDDKDHAEAAVLTQPEREGHPRRSDNPH